MGVTKAQDAPVERGQSCTQLVQPEAGQGNRLMGDNLAETLDPNEARGYEYKDRFRTEPAQKEGEPGRSANQSRLGP